MKKLFACPLLCLALTACGPIEQRVRNGLVNAGLGKPKAACMAGRMVDRLSILQLKRLASLGRFQEEKITGMGFDRFMHSIRALKDPEIVAVVSTAWVACTV